MMKDNEVIYKSNDDFDYNMEIVSRYFEDYWCRPYKYIELNYKHPVTVKVNGEIKGVGLTTTVSSYYSYSQEDAIMEAIGYMYLLIEEGKQGVIEL